jgi:flagellar hook protein FlgE
MSLFSALTASVSGMAAQANSLSTISDNIANANTTGYKDASTQFQDMLNETSTSSYNAAGVSTFVSYNISGQGQLASASSPTDLGIQGNGFFLVTNAGGATYLTRAGAFTQSKTGTLVNAAGFTLLGYSSASGATAADGVSALQPINVTGDGLKAVPSTTGVYTANLNSNAPVVTGALPSANSASSTYTSESTLTAYDNLGNPVTLNIYSTKTGTNTWEQTIYNAADAASGGGFPYSAPALSTQTLNFSAADGSLTSPTTASVAIPGGQTLTVNLAGTTQLASTFAVSAATTNGNAPSAVSSVTIGSDGTVSEVFANGSTKAIATIPLATVASVDNMTSLPGDVYQANINSGSILVGNAGAAGLGSIQSSQLESSTVDLATQLTNMIVAQNSYNANAKAFQTGSDLLAALNNLLK